MATAVVILDEARDVEYVNESARSLFAPIDPIGCSMPALLAGCEAKGGDDVSTALQTDVEGVCRVRLADGRLLDCSVRPLSSGGYVLSLDDVTTYVLSAELALRDALTGLPNRKILIERLAERINDARNSNDTFAVFFLDLDRFKAINDSLGHQIGDALLRKVAGRLKKALSDADFAARLGGDEFAVIQSAGAQPDAARALGARLVDLISRAYILEGHSLHVGASVGIAVFPKDGEDPDTLLKHADVALYRAKADGRGAFRMFESGMNNRIQRRRSMETDLRRALALKQFQLVFQPQICLTRERVAGFEALIRWSREREETVSPADFIPLAEEIGIIVPISDWVLRTACAAAARWPDDVSVAVNISPVQFRSGRLLETVTSALAGSGLSPARLDLEITEGSLLDSSDAVLGTIRSLKELGARVSMDDFGTGFSSLGYLQRFPFDKIKIDRSFIRNIDRKAESRAVLRAITGMATALGMKTTAEGVETQAELACVRSEGCTEVQGFFTGRPMAADAVAALLAASSQQPRKGELF